MKPSFSPLKTLPLGDRHHSRQVPIVGANNWQDYQILLSTRAVQKREFCSRFPDVDEMHSVPTRLFLEGKSQGRKGSSYKMTPNREYCTTDWHDCSVIREESGSWNKGRALLSKEQYAGPTTSWHTANPKAVPWAHTCRVPQMLWADAGTTTSACRRWTAKSRMPSKLHLVRVLAEEQWENQPSPCCWSLHICGDGVCTLLVMNRIPRMYVIIWCCSLMNAMASNYEKILGVMKSHAISVSYNCKENELNSCVKPAMPHSYCLTLFRRAFTTKLPQRVLCVAQLWAYSMQYCYSLSKTNQRAYVKVPTPYRQQSQRTAAEPTKKDTCHHRIMASEAVGHNPISTRVPWLQPSYKSGRSFSGQPMILLYKLQTVSE